MYPAKFFYTLPIMLTLLSNLLWHQSETTWSLNPEFEEELQVGFSRHSFTSPTPHLHLAHQPLPLVQVSCEARPQILLKRCSRSTFSHPLPCPAHILPTLSTTPMWDCLEIKPRALTILLATLTIRLIFSQFESGP